MKTYGILCFVLAIAMFVCPIFAFDLSEFSIQNVQNNFSAWQAQKTDERNAASVSVLQTASGNVIQTDEKEYVIGCVASEMSANCHEEALKAQAVAAYTNLKRLQSAPDGKSGEADISDDPAHHQGYFDEAKRRAQWGEKYEIYNEKVTEAVCAVLGQTLTYQDRPIFAAYCAISPGRTESAKVIWGEDIAYLRSVTGPGDKLSPQFCSTVTLSEAQMQKIAEKNEIHFSGEPKQWIGDLTYSENKTGVVCSARVGDRTVSGQTCRAWFSLRSPAFTVCYQDGNFVFTVYGNGHGVGMSQYSADYMARQGATYQEILQHFYPGTTLQGENA